MKYLPLHGIVVLEFNQYYSGLCAGLRLADLGARVIKVEFESGSQQHCSSAIPQLEIKDDLTWQTLNRSKESFVVNPEVAGDRVCLQQLIREAQVIIHDFHIQQLQQLGLGYQEVKILNPTIVHTSISRLGDSGWKEACSNDVLAQATSGIAYTTGDATDPPTIIRFKISEYLTGNQAVQFIIAALIRAHKLGRGACLQLSLLETLLDLQFEFLTTYFHSDALPLRAAYKNAHPLLSAPYGIYQTSDGYIAIAMMPLHKLNQVLQSDELGNFSQAEAFSRRDEIKCIIGARLLTQPTHFWMKGFRALDLWVMPVLSWKDLRNCNGYKLLDMEFRVLMEGKKSFIATRCPITINGFRLKNDKPAPLKGEHTIVLKSTFLH